MYKLELGRSLPFHKALETDYIKGLRELGYGCVDVDLCEKWYRPWEEQVECFKDMEKCTELFLEAGFKLNAVHLPFGADFDFCSTDKKVRDRAVECSRWLLDRLRPYKIPFANIHTSAADLSPDRDRKASIAAFRLAAAELSSDSDYTVCVENLPRICLGNVSEEMLELTDGLNIKIVLDVNHIFKEPIPRFVEAVGEKIATLHVSDCDGIDEKHWLPGEGVIDFTEFIAALDKVGYNGVFMLETADRPLPEYAELKKRLDGYFKEYNSRKK